MKFKVFDVETFMTDDISTNWSNIYAIGLYDGKNAWVLKDENKDNDYFIENFLNQLENKDIIYAHNGGKFDFRFILDFLDNRGIKKRLLIINGRVVKLKFRYNKNRLEFRDSFSILPTSLARLTKDFNVEHQKLKMDYKLGIKDPNFDDYFANDLKGLYEVLNLSKSLLNKSTIASNSLYDFITSSQIETIKNEQIVEDRFRYGYFGGRTEVFKMLGSDLYYYDVNSLYPYVMLKEYPYPIANNFSIVAGNFNPEKLSYWKIEAECPDDLLIPVLPVKREDGELIFPKGRINGWYYSPEIKLAIKMGYKIRFIQGYEFKKNGFIFKEYIEKKYLEKKASKGAKREIAKLLMNSLYGKFGQRRDEQTYVEISKNEFDRISNEHLYETIAIVGNSYYKIKEKQNFYSDFIHPEIAGLVTSYARTELYEWFLMAGLENVYYCDTDSMIINKEIDAKFIGSEIGQMKLEANIKEFVALAPKMYSYISKDDMEVRTRAKGFPYESIKAFSFNLFWDVLHTGNVEMINTVYSKPTSFKERNRRHKDKFASAIIVKKGLKKIYNKRIINDDYSTSPIKLENTNYK